MHHRSYWNYALLAVSLLMGDTAFGQIRDLERDDPENGELWLLDATPNKVRDGYSLFGSFRSTDDFGTSRERDFRIATQGSVARDDRTAKLHRYEPECIPLARVAKIQAEDFCDQITLQQRGDQASIQFASLDANHRYAFTLVRDRHEPTRWTSRPQFANEPSVRLSVQERGDAISWQWSMQGLGQAYSQRAEVQRDMFAQAEITALEASLVGLSELLHSFNRWEFEQSERAGGGKDPVLTPYAGWDEEPVEGGCILGVCFGNLGNAGVGGSSSNDPDDPCNPRGNNYQPQNCPWDLSLAVWPLSKRTRIWKVDDDHFGYSATLKNVGTGDFKYGSFFIGTVFLDTPEMFYFTLRKLGSTKPLVPVEQALSGNPPFPLQNCWRTQTYISPFSGQLAGDDWPFGTGPMPPEATVTHSRQSISCRKDSGRPSGRYRLHVHVDPRATYDEPTKRLNNIGSSGLMDWINIKD